MKKYKNPEDFRKSLEQKLRNISSKLNQDLERTRRKVAFERFLARLFYKKSNTWLLKGGYAMELRFDIARATKDIDLMLSDFKQFIKDDENKSLLEVLREDSSIDLEDYFEFFISEPKSKLEQPIYEGARFLVDSSIGGRRFVRFNLDVGLGDISIKPIENRKSIGWLKELGFPPITYNLINVEQQFAEKIHAYTLPRENKNSRVKDVVDILLLIESDLIDKKLLAKSISQVFVRRKTHSVPDKLDLFPKEWKNAFDNLINNCEIRISFDEAYKLLNEYYKKIINSHL
jgi:hypothetical protein